MSAFGFARGLTKSYLNNLNARAAVNVLNMSKIRAVAGMRTGIKTEIGRRLGIARGARTFGRGMKNYLWSGATGAERATRLGTVGAGAFIAGNVLNPRNNFGLSASEARQQLVDAGIDY